METKKLDAEGSAILRQILERQVYRQLMAANIRGHGLKFIPDPGRKLLLVRDLHDGLSTLEDARDLYRELGGDDLEMAVRPRMEKIPYPQSRLELAICLVACDLAEDVAMDSYLNCSSDAFARIARTTLEHRRVATEAAVNLFELFCADASQLPHAQAMFSRWFSIAVRSLGRPGSPGDQRAVALGLRSRSCGESIRLYIERLEPLLEACHLKLPDAAQTGLEIPKPKKS
jgi:hypothetical protein